MSGEWTLRPPHHRMMIAGRYNARYADELWSHRFQRSSGRARDTAVRTIMSALFNRTDALFVETLPRVVRFARLSVGGSMGRTVWTSSAYTCNQNPPGCNKRPTAADGEFSFEYKRSAVRWYYAASLQSVPRPPETALGGSPRILLLSRPLDKSRRLDNAESVLQRLREVDAARKLGVAGLECGALLDVAAALRSALLLVSTHGAQIVHAPFLPVGGGLIEILPKGFETNMYAELARHAGLRYADVRATRGTFTAAVIHAPAEEVARAAAAMLAVLPDRRLEEEVASQMARGPRAR